MKASPALRFLYGSAPGRAVLSILVRPGVSRLAGRFLDSGLSRCLIRPFARKNRISLAGIDVPAGGFPSFNAFFTRRRTAVAFDPDPARLCSPCDGLLSHYVLDDAAVLHIKNVDYPLSQLLKDPSLARSFRGGDALVFRLTPADYHRYHFVDDGVVTARRAIPGLLHTVRPIAVEQRPVFVENSREVCVLASEHFGLLAQVEVGALLVGRICNAPVSGPVRRGAEKGCFAFGGSTVVLLLPPGAIALLPDFSGPGETPVTLGQPIAAAPPGHTPAAL